LVKTVRQVAAAEALNLTIRERFSSMAALEVRATPVRIVRVRVTLAAVDLLPAAVAVEWAEGLQP
jgi:hypothetical protein